MWLGSKDTGMKRDELQTSDVIDGCKYQSMVQRITTLSSSDLRKIFAILDSLQHLEAVELQDYYLTEYGLTVGEFCTCYVLRDYVRN